MQGPGPARESGRASSFCAIIAAMSYSLPKPKYLWLPTFEGKPDDFCGWDETIRFGRIMKHSQHDFWHWHLNGTGLGGGDGQCATAREAAAALEAAYDAIRAQLVEAGAFEALRRRHGPVPE